MRVLGISGSLRRDSHNTALLRHAGELFEADGAEFEIYDGLRDIPAYDEDDDVEGAPEAVARIRAAVREADAVFFTTPEYNSSIPGGLKNAIDWTSRMKDDPFKGKPVAIQSCAGGLLGGARMQYHLRQCLTSVEAVMLIRPEVFVNFSAKKFAEGSLELTDQATKDMVKLQLEAFEKFVRKQTGKS
jgi:chromate reductase, NAD(P)H dehydrogenase (quinone)